MRHRTDRISSSIREPFFRNLLDTLPLPAEPSRVNRNILRPVHDLLFGASAALLEAYNLINLHPSTHRFSYDSHKLWRHWSKGLTADFRTDWASTPMLAAWSAGFFINKAQINISSAIDKAVSAILVAYLPAEYDPGPDDHLFYDMLEERLRLALVFVPTTLKPFLSELRQYRNWYYTRPTEAYLREYAMLRYPHRLKQRSVRTITQTLKIPSAQCVFMVIARVNTFKHEVFRDPYLLQQHGRETFIAQWAITAKALSWMRSLWRPLVRALGKKKRSLSVSAYGKKQPTRR